MHAEVPYSTLFMLFFLVELIFQLNNRIECNTSEVLASFSPKSSPQKAILSVYPMMSDLLVYQQRNVTIYFSSPCIILH